MYPHPPPHTCVRYKSRSPQPKWVIELPKRHCLTDCKCHHIIMNFFFFKVGEEEEKEEEEEEKSRKYHVTCLRK